jgi:hypothetical protein
MEAQVKIAAVINYCTNDYRFLHLCTQEALKCCSQVIVPVCDHFFNGAPENRELLERSYKENPDCHFVEYAYDPNKPYGHCPVTEKDDDWIHYWHSTGRYVGYRSLDESVTHVLFLDVDEILDSARFNAWIVTQDPEIAAFRLSSYFYFRLPIYRSLTYSLNALLVKKEAVSPPEILLDICERKGTFDEITGTKIIHAVGLDDLPLVHHYSWVRTEEELLFKVKSWGHHRDKDWEALLKEEFSQEFRGFDCLYNLKYETVEALHNPL